MNTLWLAPFASVGVFSEPLCRLPIKAAQLVLSFVHLETCSGLGTLQLLLPNHWQQTGKSKQKIKTCVTKLGLSGQFFLTLAKPPQGCHQRWPLAWGQSAYRMLSLSAPSLFLDLPLLPWCCTSSIFWSDIITVSEYIHTVQSSNHWLCLLVKHHHYICTTQSSYW